MQHAQSLEQVARALQADLVSLGAKDAKGCEAQTDVPVPAGERQRGSNECHRAASAAWHSSNRLLEAERTLEKLHQVEEEMEALKAKHQVSLEELRVMTEENRLMRQREASIREESRAARAEAQLLRKKLTNGREFGPASESHIPALGVSLPALDAASLQTPQSKGMQKRFTSPSLISPSLHERPEMMAPRSELSRASVSSDSEHS
jgi:hypothetical protein